MRLMSFLILQNIIDRYRFHSCMSDYDYKNKYQKMIYLNLYFLNQISSDARRKKYGLK